jgi:molybdenum cofactor synthesis domain-containing protein
MSALEELQVLSVNLSTKKGTPKEPLPGIQILAGGVEGDAHYGAPNREVSLLGFESIESFNAAQQREQAPGDFAENITTLGLPIYKLNPLDTLSVGELKLEISQIGKKCHGSSCGIFRSTGNCIVPTEGIFARVLQTGRLEAGMRLQVKRRALQIQIITASDRASKGVYADRSGPAVQSVLEAAASAIGYPLEFNTTVVPDDLETLRAQVANASANADAVFVTGGTGIGPRDVTPEAILPLLDKQIPGIMEMARVKFGATHPGALLSRSLAGVRGKCAIFAIPGSPSGAREYTELIAPLLRHVIYMLHGLDSHH